MQNGHNFCTLNFWQVVYNNLNSKGIIKIIELSSFIKKFSSTLSTFSYCSIQCQFHKEFVDTVNWFIIETVNLLCGTCLALKLLHSYLLLKYSCSMVNLSTWALFSVTLVCRLVNMAAWHSKVTSSNCKLGRLCVLETFC